MHLCQFRFQPKLCIKHQVAKKYRSFHSWWSWDRTTLYQNEMWNFTLCFHIGINDAHWKAVPLIAPIQTNRSVKFLFKNSCNDSGQSLLNPWHYRVYSSLPLSCATQSWCIPCAAGKNILYNKLFCLHLHYQCESIYLCDQYQCIIYPSSNDNSSQECTSLSGIWPRTSKSVTLPRSIILVSSAKWKLRCSKFTLLIPELLASSVYQLIVPASTYAASQYRIINAG